MQNKHSRKEDDAPPGVVGGCAARMPPHLALSAATCFSDLTMTPPPSMILLRIAAIPKFIDQQCNFRVKVVTSPGVSTVDIGYKFNVCEVILGLKSLQASSLG